MHGMRLDLRYQMGDSGTHREAARRRAACQLRELLAGRPSYRQRWVREARRSPGAGLNYTAIARVLMDWWYDAGERNVGNGDPPLDLVRRALTGEFLTPQTLNHLMQAFGFTEEDEQELWAIYNSPCDEDHGSTNGPVA